MMVKSTSKLIILSILFLTFLNIVSATDIGDCGTINNSGSYQLNQSIYSVNTCLIIGSSDVDLDCNGNSITYATSGTASRFGIDVFFGVTPLSNVTIRNCLIQKNSSLNTAGYGIRLQRTSNSRISNNTIITNGTTNNYGIYLLTSANSNIIDNNTITSFGSSTGSAGIYLVSDSNNNNITGNTVNSYGTTTSYALFISTDANDNLAENNNFSSFTLSGSGNTDTHTINIFSSKRNDLINNRIYSNGFTRNYATYINTNANNNTIANNIIVGHGLGTTNYGIYVLNSRLNSLINNSITTYGTTTNHGIVFSGSYNSEIINNTIVANGTSTGNFGISIVDTLTTNIQNNNISTFGTTTGYGISLTTSSYINMTNNLISTNGSGATNTGILLTTSFYNSMDGNSISTWGTSANAGIFLTTTSNENTITNNTILARGTTTLNYGIYATQSQFNIIDSNNISTNGGTTTNYGIELITQANRNIVRNNTISTLGTTTNHGVFISTSSYNTFIGNSISTNSTTRSGATNNWGTYLTVNSNENVFYNNNITTDGGGSNYGVYLLTDCDRNIFQGNTVNAGGEVSLNIGFLLTASSKNLIKDNTVSTRGTVTNYGTELLSSSSNNILENNTISTSGSTTSYGIYLLFSTPNYPVNNSIIRNNLVNIVGTDLFVGTASINNTWLIDQSIGNYSIAGVGGIINVRNSSVGEIRFLQPLTGTTQVNFSSRINLVNDYAFIDPAISVVNKSAEITLYNISTTSTELQILRNGAVCPASICTNLTPMQAGNVTFNVSYGGNYSINASTSNPVVTLNSPSDQYNATYKDITFNFTASDDVSTILNCSIYINSILNQTNSSTSSGVLTNFLVQNIGEGNYSWKVSCYDGGDNLGDSSPRNFNVSYASPTITFNFPSNNSYLNNINSVTFNYTSYESNLNNMTIYLYGDGVLLNTSYNITNGTTLTYLLNEVSLGQHNWTAIASNQLKNTSNDLRYFNVINLTINCEAGGPYQSGALVLIQGNVSDGSSGLSSNSINVSIYESGTIYVSRNLTSLSDGSFQTTFASLANGNYVVNASSSYQGYNQTCSDSFEISSGSSTSPTPASLILDKIVSLQNLNSTTIIYNITLSLTNSGGSNSTNTNITDSDSTSSPYIMGLIISANRNQTSYTKAYLRNSTSYNSTLSLASSYGIDNYTANQISANSSIITIIIPATTANTNMTLTKNAQFLSENETSVTYTLTSTFVNSGGSDMLNINISDADISLNNLISLNTSQSYSTSASKTITKSSTAQTYNFLRSNATYNSVTYASNQLQILIPALNTNASLSLIKASSLYAETSLNITYNISLSLTNIGGVNSTNTNITDSDSTSSPYLLNNITSGQSILRSYLLTLAKSSSSVSYALSNATSYGLDGTSGLLISANSSPLIVNIPAISTNASLSLTKLSSVYSLNQTYITYNISLSLTNIGGVNSTNTNITDSDSTSSPYLLNNITSGQTTIRSYLINYPRSESTSITTLSGATSYGIDSISNNLISASASSSNITIPGNLTLSSTSASLILDKVVSLKNITNNTVAYNITLRLTNKGGVNSTNTNITDSDSTSSPYTLENITAGETVIRSYILNYTRNSTTYPINLSSAISYGIDSLTNNSINSNSSILSILIPSNQLGQQVILIKNAYFNSQNSTSVNYTVSIQVVNSGGEDLSGITIIDSDLSLNTLISLNRTDSYNYSSNLIIQKAASNTEKLFVKATATVNSVSYESNQINLQIPGYGGPADTVVYAQDYVSPSTSFDSIVQVTNQNPDIGQNFLIDYWITNQAENTNYSSGQQTTYIAPLDVTNITITFTSPSTAGMYRLRALVTYVGGPDIAYDSFEVNDSASGGSSGGGGSSGSSNEGGNRITGKATDEVICNSPYIRHETGCCLDSNNNSICDNDEIGNKDENKTTEENPNVFNINETLEKIKELLSFKLDNKLKSIIQATILAIIILAIILLIRHRIKSKAPKDMKRLRSIKGTKVYAENGDYIGKVKDVYLVDKLPKIYGWLVELDKKLARKTGVKRVLLRSRLVKSIKEIMVIDEYIDTHLDKFKEEIK